MKIVKVEYRRLVSDDNYNNETHGAEAIVEEQDSPSDVHKRLVAWVDEKVKESRIGSGLDAQVCDLKNEVVRLGYEKDRLSGECTAILNKITRMKDFLKAHGVEINFDELPF
jgi:hypothetical protein